MKRIFVLILAAALALSCAYAEQTIEPIGGVIADITETSFLIDRGEAGYVVANIGEDMTINGADELEIGMYVFVDYTGIMTRSIPPQITATEVNVYILTGTCAEVESDSFTLISDQMGEVVVTYENANEFVAAGSPVKVYHSNAVMLSLPARVNALKVDTFAIEGSVYSIEEDGFLLKTESAVLYKIMSDAAVSEGESVKVLYDGKLTRSIPAQANALAVIKVNPAA